MSRRLARAVARLCVLLLVLLAGCGAPERPGSSIAAVCGPDAAGAAGAPAPAPTVEPAPAPPATPSIVFVLTDDLSWNLVKYMPNVQQMQHDGATFSSYFVSNSLCCPSRATTFTGMYPHNTNIFGNVGPTGGYAKWVSSSLKALSFAPALQASGYQTSLLGKFLNGYTAKGKADPGWSDWHVGGYAYGSFNYDLNENGAVVHYGTAATDYLTDVLARRAQEFVAATPGPFFLEVATFSPHGPYVAAPRHRAKFLTLSYPRTPAFAARPTASDPAWLQGIPPLTSNNIVYLDRSYRQRLQAVQAIDEMVGQLRQQLAGRGAYILFTSDNGYHMGERSQRVGKMNPYDTDTRVPLIVVGPDVPAGLVVDAIAQNVDLAPTFADLSGAPLQNPPDGVSLAPLLRGLVVTDWRSAALVEHHGEPLEPGDPDLNPEATGMDPPTYQALRTATGLYVEYGTGEIEYHDVATDPEQLSNTVSALPEADVGALHARLAALSACKGTAACVAASH